MQTVEESPQPEQMPLEAGCAQARQYLQAGQAAQAWALLQQLAQAHPQHAVVPRLQGAVLSATGQPTQALVFYRAALALAPNDAQILVAAGACLHLLGQLPLAVQHYRAALVWQCCAPLRMVDLPHASVFDSAAAEQRLWQVLTALASAGVHAFATSGTLLGLVREGHVLPFDKDLDIGLPFDEMQTAIEFLLQNGWHRAAAPQGMVNPVMLHDGQGLSLDLCGFVAEQCSGAALSGFWLQGASADWQRVTQYPVLRLHQQQRPEGMVWAVTDPEAWLVALYGPDWRTPDPDFDTVIAAHNLRGFAVLTQCYAFSRIYQAWLQGRLQKAAALTRQSLRHLPDDALLLQVQQRLALQQQPETQAAPAALGHGKRILVTGVFDLFHVGHLRYLQYARRQGARLTVAVTPDALCLARKGKQPAIHESQRLEIVQGLGWVDEARFMPTSLELTQETAGWISAWHIDLVVVGGEWEGSARWQRLIPVLAERGIAVLFAPHTQGISSTDIAQRIRQRTETTR